MNLEQLQADLRTHFAPERRTALTAILRDSYAGVAAGHSPCNGDNAQVFGFRNYHWIGKRLLELCGTQGIELAKHHPNIRLGVGPFILAAYCCGSSGDQDIYESFPLNENGAPQMADLNQFCLELDDELAVPRAIVLAHLGNCINGLEALYLAVPAARSHNRIAGWCHAELLWKWSAGEQDGDVQPDLPRPVVIPPAPLSLKLHPDRTTGSDK